MKGLSHIAPHAVLRLKNEDFSRDPEVRAGDEQRTRSSRTRCSRP